jgi:hypothetical protein
MSTSEPADPEPNPDPIAVDAPSVALAALERELALLQRSIRMAISTKLNQFAGQSMGSIEENRKLVEAIARLLDSHGLRIQCSECGHPSILRISPRGSSGGAFVFDHTIEGRRTFHGGKGQLPEIRLVTKPLRQKNPSNKKTPGKLAS